MGHHEIEPLTDVTPVPVTLEHQLSTFQQKSRLRCMLLGSELPQPAVKRFRKTQIHGHLPKASNTGFSNSALAAHSIHPLPHKISI